MARNSCRLHLLNIICYNTACLGGAKAEWQWHTFQKISRQPSAIGMYYCEHMDHDMDGRPCTVFTPPLTDALTPSRVEP